MIKVRLILPQLEITLNTQVFRQINSQRKNVSVLRLLTLPCDFQQRNRNIKRERTALKIQFITQREHGVVPL